MNELISTDVVCVIRRDGTRQPTSY